MALQTVSTISGGTIALAGGTKTFTGFTQVAGVQPSNNIIDTFPNDGRTFCEATIGATSTTVTVTQQNPNSQGEKFNPTTGALTSTTRIFGPFDPSLYNDTNGLVSILFSQNTSVTCRYYRLAEKFSGN